jgi:hypothetical protein
MIETIIYTIGLMLPSFILGYCVRWMNEEQTKVKQINTNKTSNILPPI